jgi:hypothetical protein
MTLLSDGLQQNTLNTRITINQWKFDDRELFGDESSEVRIPSKKIPENWETDS